MRHLGLTSGVRNVRIDARGLSQKMMRVAAEKKKFTNSKVNEQRISFPSFFMEPYLYLKES